MLLALEAYHRPRIHRKRMGLYHQQELQKIDALMDGQNETVMKRLEDQWRQIEQQKSDQAEAISAFIPVLNNELSNCPINA